MLSHLKKCKAVDGKDLEEAQEKRKAELKFSQPSAQQDLTSPNSNAHSHSKTESAGPPLYPTTQSCNSHQTGDDAPHNQQKTDYQGLSESEMQGEFLKDFTRLLVANGVAWYAAENPETKAFVNRWCPKVVHVPHRQSLAGSLLDKAVEMAVGKVQARVKGGLATGECDGWTNGSKTPIETLMMTVANKVRLDRLDGGTKANKPWHYSL